MSSLADEPPAGAGVAFGVRMLGVPGAVRSGMAVGAIGVGAGREGSSTLVASACSDSRRLAASVPSAAKSVSLDLASISFRKPSAAFRSPMSSATAARPKRAPNRKPYSPGRLALAMRAATLA